MGMGSTVALWGHKTWSNALLMSQICSRLLLMVTEYCIYFEYDVLYLLNIPSKEL